MKKTVIMAIVMTILCVAGVKTSMAAETPNGYDALAMADCLDAGKLTVSVKDSKTSVSDSGDGVHIKATAEAIEQGEIRIDQSIDFGEIRPGFVIVDGLSERRKEAKVSIYLDDQNTPIGTITIPRQRGKNKWDYSMNYSADISGKNIIGEHTVRLKISYPNIGSDTKKEKTDLFLRSVHFAAEDIPTVQINIDESEGTIAEMNSDPAHATECCGDISIRVPEGYVSEYGGENPTGTYELEYIRGRGNSTWGPQKKPYRIKLDKKADLFGMGADKNWVLLANYYDYTLIRNKYTYWLGEKLGMEFTPQCVFVNVVVNGEYLGSYYLCEHVRVGKSRIDIDDLEDQPEATSGSDLTGGYLLSLGTGEGDSDFRTFMTKMSLGFLIENPDFSDVKPVEEQYNYIRDYVQQVEDALFGDGFKDKNGKSYTEYMDLQSAVDFYLIQEFSSNGDGYLGGSNYLYKKRNGKLYWGPLWDFDYVAWGATEFYGNSVEGFTHASQTWVARMLKDKAFRNLLLERWKTLKSLLEQSIAEGGEIDRLVAQLYMSQKVNYQVSYTVADSDSELDPETGEKVEIDYDSEIQRFKDWIRDRISWVDNNIGKEIKYKDGKTITFKVGKKVYKKVVLPNRGYLEADQIPTPPKKKGYSFRGWYAKDKNGAEYNVLNYEIVSNVTVYARFVKNDTVKGGSKIFFIQSNLYYPADDGSGYNLMCSSYPGTVTPDKIKWSTDTGAARVTDGLLYVDVGFRGTVTVTAKYKKTKIKCKVHIREWYELMSMRTVAFKKKNITMTKGTYKVLKLVPSPANANSYGLLGAVTYFSQNEKVIDINQDGVIHALKKGKTVVVAMVEGQMIFCNVTVKNKKNTKKKK